MQSRKGEGGGVSTLFYKGIIIIEGICYLLLRSIDDADDDVDERKGGHIMNVTSLIERGSGCMLIVVSLLRAGKD